MFRFICAMTTVIPLLVVTGCLTPDPTVDLLESELRWMEDNLYQMDHQLDQCYAQLESARRYNTSLREELAATRRGVPSTGATGAEKDDVGYDVETEEDLYSFDAPIIELGDPDDEQDATQSREDDLEGAGERRIPILELQNPETDQTPGNPEEDSDDAVSDPKRVTKILLNPRLTGGYDFDGRPGHEGVMVVIEPQNAQGQYVSVPGELLIEVTDPRKQGMAAQVGKWRFDALESAAYFKESLMGRGAHLKLPWPGEPPIHQRLRLTVVYDTIEGRKLRAEKTITVKTGSHALASRSDITTRTASWTSRRPGDTNTAGVVELPAWRPTRPK